MHPVVEEWQNPELTHALSSFSGFCSLVGMEGLPQYLNSHHFASAKDWSNTPLDAEGKARQDGVHSRIWVRVAFQYRSLGLLTLFVTEIASECNQEPA